MLNDLLKILEFIEKRFEHEPQVRHEVNNLKTIVLSYQLRKTDDPIKLERIKRKVIGLKNKYLPKDTIHDPTTNSTPTVYKTIS
jgi:hypothetical protein